MPPAIKVIIPIPQYNAVNMPNIQYCFSLLSSARYLAVYLMTAFPKPKSSIER